MDIHKLRAAEMFGVSVEDVTEDQRRAAKADSFSKLYNGGGIAINFGDLRPISDRLSPEGVGADLASLERRLMAIGEAVLPDARATGRIPQPPEPQHLPTVKPDGIHSPFDRKYLRRPPALTPINTDETQEVLSEAEGILQGLRDALNGDVIVTTVIKSFKGDYRFLSNFWPVKVEFEGVVYQSTEAAYQAAKTLDLAIRQQIADFSSPNLAKRAGRWLVVRRDWDDIRLEVMLELQRKKYKDPVLRQKLLDTGDSLLVEGNTWGDTFWGVCNGEGENHLGKILMKVRREIAEEKL